MRYQVVVTSNRTTYHDRAATLRDAVELAREAMANMVQDGTIHGRVDRLGRYPDESVVVWRRAIPEGSLRQVISCNE